ncbi:hypothetical protein AVEN_117009-1 [Araneus ventricosus]|uniref:Uncharacterized protein n=1 Tax=Araneus ventricosus TaxID=182803 RepID=A0A4Y2UB53_ARAVE|nr:hypothetical protein AVEN_117009-1 [Araneus ventricosus]
MLSDMRDHQTLTMGEGELPLSPTPWVMATCHRNHSYLEKIPEILLLRLIYPHGRFSRLEFKSGNSRMSLRKVDSQRTEVRIVYDTSLN